MLIDWFTVLAQLVNFLVLVWLLKRFLFRPIVSAMDSREQKVLAQLRNAEEQQAAAKAESEKLALAREELDQKRQALIHEAEAEADALRRRLTEDARRKVEELRAKWHDLLRDEQAAIRTELADKAQREIFSICRQILRDLAGVKLEEQIAVGFARRIQELDADEKLRLASNVLPADQSPVIRSAFALPVSSRTVIENAVAGLRSDAAGKPIRYEVVPDLLGGIELATDGRKVGWSIAGYLASLEETIRRSANLSGEAAAKADLSHETLEKVDGKKVSDEHSG